MSEQTPPTPPQPNGPEQNPQNIHHMPRIPVWRRKWFQICISVLVVITVLTIILPPVFSLLNLVSGVLIPLAIAFTLAYIVNPLVTFLERSVKISRPISATALLSLVAIAILALVVYVVPPLVSQSTRLIRQAPVYARTLYSEVDKKFGVQLSEVRQQLLGRFSPSAESTQTEATEPTEDTATATTTETDGASSTTASKLSTNVISPVSSVLKKIVSTSFGVIASTLGFASYLALSLGIIIFAFFFFTWKFQSMIEWFIPFIPATHKDHTLNIIKKMDACTAAFIRGRLIQMSIITIVLAGGWWFFGVPFWLLLAIIGGLLNLIPYAPVLIWPTVVLTTYLTALTGDAPQALLTDAGTINYLAVFLYPSLVYFAAQGLDGWVVEPLVQGKATNLDPLTVMIVVLLGAAILGILGMLIAIPVAACIKILSSEVILPKLRGIAEQN